MSGRPDERPILAPRCLVDTAGWIGNQHLHTYGPIHQVFCEGYSGSLHEEEFSVSVACISRAKFVQRKSSRVNNQIAFSMTPTWLHVED